MKSKTCEQILIAICFVFILATASSAEELSAADKDYIKGVGIPIYSGATFVYGNKSVGYRFATAKSSEDVKAWYEKQLSEWSVFNEYGSWLLYKGKPGLKGEAFSKPQVQIQNNPKLSEWYGIDKSLTTEIVIYIPQ